MKKDFYQNLKMLLFLIAKISFMKVIIHLETLEIMRNLDLIISADTAVAHIASSLSLKTFLMLEHSPFWYFEGDEKNNIYQNLILSILIKMSLATGTLL